MRTHRDGTVYVISAYQTHLFPYTNHLFIEIKTQIFRNLDIPKQSSALSNFNCLRCYVEFLIFFNIAGSDSDAVNNCHHCVVSIFE